MWNFPSAPTAGQIFEPIPGSPPAYTYNGVAWDYSATTQLVITALIPNTAEVGSADLTVRAIGANFTDTTEVLLDNVVADDILFVSPSELTFTVKASLETVPRTAIVTVQDPSLASDIVHLVAKIGHHLFNEVVDPAVTGGIGAVPFQFTAVTVLTITMLVPETAQCGSPDLIVSAHGANFTNSCEILFDGVAVPTTYVSPTQLTFDVSPLTETVPRQVPVTVRDGVTAGIGTPPFSFTNAIIIEELDPPFGRIGNASLPVLVIGEGFLSNSVVYYDGAAIPTVYSSGTELQITLDGSAATPGPIDIEVHNGTLISNVLPFTWAVTPTITSVVPDAIGISDPLHVITVTGTGYTTDSRILEGVTERTTTFVSATEVTFEIDPAAEGAGAHSASINVQTGTGRPPVVSLAADMQYWINPEITVMTPTTAAIAAGDFVLNILGSGMGEGTIIIFDGVEQVTTQLGPAEFEATITPTGAARTVEVTVRHGHVGHTGDDIRPTQPPHDFTLT